MNRKQYYDFLEDVIRTLATPSGFYNIMIAKGEILIYFGLNKKWEYKRRYIFNHCSGYNPDIDDENDAILVFRDKETKKLLIKGLSYEAEMCANLRKKDPDALIYREHL